MNAEQRIQKLLDLINSGKTVLIGTALRVTKINKKTLTKWEKSGHTLLKSEKDSMFMAQGNKFVCIDYCSFQIEG